MNRAPAAQSAPRDSAAPPGNQRLAMAYDVRRSASVLFDGSQTWEWDGREWLRRDREYGPGLRDGHALVYDGDRGVIVLFGGREDRGTVLGDAWAWDGDSWKLLSGDGPPRTHHALAFDSRRGVIVMFGGSGPCASCGDTWEWDGAAWIQRASDGPGPRFYHSLAFDESRGVTVLFGAYPASDETWEWNGSDWKLRSTSGPPPRCLPALAYEGERRTTILYGGAAGSADFDDMWEWDGAAWSPLAFRGPGPRAHHALTYDAARARLVLFGGNPSPFINDTWEFGAFRACDANCDGSVNVFDIDAFISVLRGDDGCSDCGGDANGDGTANPFDIQAFLGCLAP